MVDSISYNNLFSIHSTHISEKAMAPHSSTLAWKIPWAEEPGRLQSMGLLGVRHDWATSLSFSCTGEGNGNPLQYSCLENPRDGGAWWAAVYGVAQSRTWLKQLSKKYKVYVVSINNFVSKEYEHQYLCTLIMCWALYRVLCKCYLY